jgi:hypothetical protein
LLAAVSSNILLRVGLCGAGFGVQALNHACAGLIGPWTPPASIWNFLRTPALQMITRSLSENSLAEAG